MFPLKNLAHRGLIWKGLWLMRSIGFKKNFMKEWMSKLEKSANQDSNNPTRGDIWRQGIACHTINTLRPRQTNHFADKILKWIFLNENVWILLKISLKFVPKVRFNNIPALDQIMAWGLPGNKTLSEPMMVWLLTYIYVTQPQWVKYTHLVWLCSFGHSSEIDYSVASTLVFCYRWVLVRAIIYAGLRVGHTDIYLIL